MSEAWKAGSSTRWRRFRVWLLQEWEKQGRDECEIRGPRCTKRIEQVDHITPLHMGGSKYDPHNCRPSCEPCNTGRRVQVEQEPQPRKVSSW